MKLYYLFLFGIIFTPAHAQQIDPEIAKAAENIEKQVIEWRRDFHQNPELSNREFETAKKIADHLTNLGIEIQTGVAKTGVVGILKGNNPGKVVALRADIDALPVTERNDLPLDRKSTRLNSSHVKISYAVFCLK